MRARAAIRRFRWPGVMVGKVKVPLWVSGRGW